MNNTNHPPPHPAFQFLTNYSIYSTNAPDKSYHLVELPWPPPISYATGQRNNPTIESVNSSVKNDVKSNSS